VAVPNTERTIRLRAIIMCLAVRTKHVYCCTHTREVLSALGVAVDAAHTADCYAEYDVMLGDIYIYIYMYSSVYMCLNDAA
jgi:hypothetical protein